MPKSTDVRPTATTLYYLPIKTRMPLKFGPEITTEVTCARVRMEVADARGRTAVGWGETPLSVQWVWPSALSYEARHRVLKQFTEQLAAAWARFATAGHPIEVGATFTQQVLPGQWNALNRERGPDAEPMPWLAALVCSSAFDLALHDAYGVLHGVPVYETYNAEYMNADLAHFLIPVQSKIQNPKSKITFSGQYPADFL